MSVHHPQLSRDERESAWSSALEDVGLDPETRFRYPHEFSGGQRQRIAVARAIVLEPTFIVLDEPTSALDMLIQSQMVDLLRDLQKRHDLTYLFISHDLRVVAALASRLMVMRHGKVVEEGPAVELFKQPKSDYTRALFAAAFNLETAPTASSRSRSNHSRLTLVIVAAGFAGCGRPPFRKRLDRHRHVKRIGVDHASRASRTIATWPCQKIRSPRCSIETVAGTGRSQRRLLHVAVARAMRCRRHSARSAPGPSNRCRSWSCRPTDRACRQIARRPRHSRLRYRSMRHEMLRRHVSPPR